MLSMRKPHTLARARALVPLDEPMLFRDRMHSCFQRSDFLIELHIRFHSRGRHYAMRSITPELANALIIGKSRDNKRRGERAYMCAHAGACIQNQRSSPLQQ